MAFLWTVNPISLNKHPKHISMFHLQAVLPGSDEDIPQIIYVGTDLSGVHNNIINVVL